MRVLTVLGTRPEIIRLSRIIPAIDQVADHTLVHTGQNAAANLSQVFFEELGVRTPDVALGVDTSSLGRQLATLYEGFEQVLDQQRPDKVLILGDTNSGLVAYNCKRRGIPVFHMEAGNRCYDDRVPEEVNRRVIDHCSTILLPYTERSAENLVKEGIPRHRIFVTGNPMFEVLAAYAPQIEASPALAKYGLEERRYLLATIHRAENVDDPAVFARLCKTLVKVADAYDMPLLLSVHPRIAGRIEEAMFANGNVRTTPAMPFFEFVKLQKHAALVLSDSGTVPEECAILRVPVVTLRDTTERPELLEAGCNIVASTEPARIMAAADYLRRWPGTEEWTAPPEYLVPNVTSKVIRLLLGNTAPSSACC